MIDLSGNRYGKLVVIEFSHYQRTGNDKRWYWKCRCDCGNLAVVSAGDLKRKNPTKATKSCGCRKKTGSTRPSKLKSGESSFNRIYYQYGVGAVSRQLSFDISKSFAKKVMSLNCFYCGASPSNRSSGKGRKGEYLYNGMDRIDNTKGYTEENVVPCCSDCNRAKRTMTYLDFKSWVFRVSDYLLSKSK